MRVEQKLRYLGTMGGFGVAVLTAACGSARKSNEGFPKAIEDLVAEDYEDSLWKKIRAILGIDPVGGTSEDDLITNLASLSDLVAVSDLAELQAQAQIAKVVGDAEKSVCLDIKIPPTALRDAFKINNGDPAPKALPLPARVFRFEYKLTGDTDFRQALVTVPQMLPGAAHAAAAQIAVQSESSGSFGYPILMYGHAAASGLAYEEIALSLGDLQSGHIIAAPVFPGEPLCASYDTIAGVKTSACTGSNILAAPVGTSLPYENDVTDLLGLHDCMKKWVAAGASGGAEDLSTKIVAINASAKAALAPSAALFAAAAGAPVSIVSGLGRGASVAGLALARAGAINSVYFAASPDATAVAALGTKGAVPALFSCSLMIAPQASFTSGKNKLYLDFWGKGSSTVLSPAQQVLADSIPTFASVHAKIQGIRTHAGLSEDDKAAVIGVYVKGIDLLLNIPLMHGGLQNFGKQFTARLLLLDPTKAAAADHTLKAAQGAALVLHGSKDAIADVGNSVLLSNVGVGLSSGFSPPLEPAGEEPPAGAETPAEGGGVEDPVEPTFIQGINWLALEIQPPEDSLDENGQLPAGDFGHVASVNFANGKSIENSNTQSNIVTTEFLNLTPGDVTGKWLATQCTASINATAVP